MKIPDGKATNYNLDRSWLYHTIQLRHPVRHEAETSAFFTGRRMLLHLYRYAMTHTF